MCYLEGCSKFLVTYHDTLRHMLTQLNNRLNKRQARYLRDLQPFVGTMTLAYRKGALNEAYTLRQRPNLVPYAKVLLFGDGEVPSHAKSRLKSEPLLKDAQLNLMIINVLRLSLEFVDFVRKGYSQDSFYGDEGGWTRDTRIEARACYSWRLNLLYTPRNSKLRQRLIYEMHNILSVGHRGVVGALAKALDRFLWKRSRQDLKDLCERCVVCRRANIKT
jgi:hypothetical protein